MRIVHLWVGAIDALEHAPGGVAVQRAGGVVQGGARLWQGEEVQATLAVQEGISARQQGGSHSHNQPRKKRGRHDSN